MQIRRVPQSRAERLIAGGRLFLAAASFGAIYLDPLEPARYPTLTYSLLACYAAYALLVAIWTAVSPLTTGAWQKASHALDLTFFGTINAMTLGPTSPFFIYFAFSIICAMLRFGRAGTLLTASASFGVYAASSVSHFGAADFELNRFIIRMTYLGVIAWMLIFLSAYQDRLHRDLQRIAQWPRSPHRSLEDLVTQLMQEAASIFGARRVLLAYTHRSETLAYLAVRSGRAFEVRAQSEDAARLLLDRDGGAYASSVALSPWPDDHARQAIAAPPSAAGLPPEIVERYQIDQVVATPFRGEFVRGQLLLLDGGLPLLEEINLAEIAGGVIAGRLDHYYAGEQLQRGAVAEERVRVARDLHDSVLQSLTGVALQLRTLPRLMMGNREEATRRLSEIEQVLLAGQKDLRWFIDELRPGGKLRDATGTGGLAERLSHLADRFREQWNLAVDIRMSPSVHLLPVSMRYEIFAIVNEAVANAAKHANAECVVVEIDAHEGEVTIEVRDDGQGFAFHGTYTLDDLIATRRGPVTLKERVAALGGDLHLTSSLDGSSVAIRLPVAGGGGV